MATTGFVVPDPNRQQLHKYVDMLNEYELEIALTYISNLLLPRTDPVEFERRRRIDQGRR